MATEYRRASQTTSNRRGVTTFNNYRAYGPKVKSAARTILGEPDPFFVEGAMPDEHVGAEMVTYQHTFFPGSEQLDEMNRRREAKGEHPTLFHQDPMVISSLFSDPKMTHTVPTLLGLAHNQSGGFISPSHDLSPYSSKLAKKGMEKGWVVPNEDNPHAYITNSNSFHPYQFPDEPSMHGEAVPEGEVKAARGTVRKLLRDGKSKTDTSPEQAPAPKPAHLSSQFHPQLPGLEG